MGVGLLFWFWFFYESDRSTPPLFSYAFGGLSSLELAVLSFLLLGHQELANRIADVNANANVKTPSNEGGRPSSSRLVR